MAVSTWSRVAALCRRAWPSELVVSLTAHRPPAPSEVGTCGPIGRGASWTQHLARVIGSLVRPNQVRLHLKDFTGMPGEVSHCTTPALNWGKSVVGRRCRWSRHAMASSMCRRAPTRAL
jgi:hypothetical protein